MEDLESFPIPDFITKCHTTPLPLRQVERYAQADSEAFMVALQVIKHLGKCWFRSFQEVEADSPFAKKKNS